MNTLARPRILLSALALVLLGACASSPHGSLYPAMGSAPDLVTGNGCDNFGVVETVPVPEEKLNFKPSFVGAMQIDEVCPSSGRQAIWGCYHPDGRAYIVGKDFQVYWHEWCHAKFGGQHTALAKHRNDYIAPSTIASNPAP